MAWAGRLSGILLLDGLLDGRLRSPGGLLARFVIAAALVAGAVGLRLWLDPWLSGSQFITLFPAVLLTTLLCGTAPGLFAVALSAVASRLIFGHADFTFREENSIVLFVLVGVMDVAAVSASLAATATTKAALARVAHLNASLQLSETRFRDLIQSAPDAVVIAGGDDRIALVNAEAERLFGYKAGELVGRSIDVLMPERDRPAHQGRVARFIRAPGIRRMGGDRDLYGLHKDGTEFPIETNLSVLPGGDDRGSICAVIRDLTDRREILERQDLLIRELNHRVKNTLASVQSMVRRTVLHATSPQAFQEALTARLMALSQSHDVLTRRDWAGAPIHDIVAEQLKPYDRGPCAPFRLSGPDVILGPNRSVTLGMALGELATNAAKYGPLSRGGSVEVSWETSDRDGTTWLRLVWRERGGPPLTPPSRRGFGLQLIDRSLASGLGGSAKLVFAPEGLTCTLEFPLEVGEAQDRRVAD